MQILKQLFEYYTKKQLKHELTIGKFLVTIMYTPAPRPMSQDEYMDCLKL